MARRRLISRGDGGWVELSWFLWMAWRALAKLGYSRFYRRGAGAGSGIDQSTDAFVFRRGHRFDSNHEAHLCYVCISSVCRGQLCLRRQPVQRWRRRVSAADIIVSNCSQHGWIRWRRRHEQEGRKEGRQKVWRWRGQCPSQAQGEGTVGQVSYIT